MRAKRAILLHTSILCSFLSSMLLQACSSSRNNVSLRILVGTYTEGTGSAGVYLYDLNPDTCEATLIDTAAAGNPSFIIVPGSGKSACSAKQRRTTLLEESAIPAYAVSEYSDGRQAVLTFKIDSNSIDAIASQPGPTGDPCNILAAGGRIFTADYTGGMISVFPLAGDGTVGALEGWFDPGAGPGIQKPTRSNGMSQNGCQTWNGSHMHCATLSPDGRYVFFTDLGKDAVYRIEIDNPSSFCTAWQYGEPACQDIHAGPRHLTFSPDGRFAYLICEIGDMLTSFSYSDGKLTHIDSRLAYDGEGHGSGDIHLTPDGRFLYTSHRLKKDGIAVFRIGKDGIPQESGYQLTGIHPRNFTITPDGSLLLCACRDSNCIEIYSINKKDGTLKDTGKRIGLPAPVCVQIIG